LASSPLSPLFSFLLYSPPFFQSHFVRSLFLLFFFSSLPLFSFILLQVSFFLCLWFLFAVFELSFGIRPFWNSFIRCFVYPWRCFVPCRVRMRPTYRGHERQIPQDRIRSSRSRDPHSTQLSTSTVRLAFVHLVPSIIPAYLRSKLILEGSSLRTSSARDAKTVH